MSEHSSRICILGGGFGGLYTALRLSQFPWASHQTPEITLVDRSDRFLFLPLLYELITDELEAWEIAPSFEKLLADTPIHFRQATVTGIDCEAKAIKFHDNATLAYDQLAIALGGKTSLDFVPGAKEHAIPFYRLNDAETIKQRLRLLENAGADKIRVAVVGGGYSGIELACKMADRLGKIGRVRIIELSDEILANSTHFNRKAAKKALEARKIWIDYNTEVTEIHTNSISLKFKQEIDTIPVDLVLWTVGNQASELIPTLPLKRNSRGLLLTEPTLQVPDYPEVFALGDAAASQDASGNALPATAQVALQQADYCAWNLWASSVDKPLLPFSYQPLGEMLALGVDGATLSGLGVELDGLFAYLLRRLVYLYRQPTFSHQLAVGTHWLTRPLLEWLEFIF